jgi:cytochrome c
MKRALFALTVLAAVSAPALADQALANAKNCMACHAVDKLAVKIMKGGAGVWGPVPMPANAQVNEAEAKKLASWVLTQK